MIQLQSLKKNEMVTITFQNGVIYPAQFLTLMKDPNGARFLVEGRQVSVLSAEVLAGWTQIARIIP